MLTPITATSARPTMATLTAADYLAWRPLLQPVLERSLRTFARATAGIDHDELAALGVARFGGVVPEVASRRHLELVAPVISAALESAEVPLERVERIAVTQGPGLVGALLVGISAAKALAWARRLPLTPVDHLEGHLASLYLQPDALERVAPPA